MDEKEKKELLDSLHHNSLDETTSFHDMMGRREKKALEKRKEEEQEDVKRKLFQENLEEQQRSWKQQEETKALQEEVKMEQTKALKELMRQSDPLEEPKKKRKKSALSILGNILAILTFLGSGAYLAYLVIVKKDQVDQTYMIILASLLVFLSFSILLSWVIKKETAKKAMGLLTTIALIAVIVFQFLVVSNIIKLKTLPTLPDFTNQTISEALLFGKAHDIEITQDYVYSDTYSEYQIVGQNTLVGTLLKEVKTLRLVVSKGPNYDQTVILPQMVGWTVDQVLDYIKTNYLNNVTINFESNLEVARDTLIRQDKNGQVRRNEAITLTFSLGDKNALPEVKMIDLKDKTLFDAELWLKRNGISYNKTYVFSEEVKRNNIVSTDIKIDTMVKPFSTKVNLVVSKGKKITVPEFGKMDSTEIIQWVMDNNLKIQFKEAYHESIEKGKVIKGNYKLGDTIEEGTLIEITTSKGKLKLEKFNTLIELRDWANKNGITLEETYQFDNSVAKGNIIKTYPSVGDVLKTGDVIKVTISNGKAVTIPNFVGKSKSEVMNTCYQIGLSCSYVSDGYNNAVAKDVVTRQSKQSGAQVVSGTSITIYLSAGKASTYKIVIQDSWFTASINSADAGISMLRSKLASLAPGVTFNFVKKSSNSLPAGYIHENSPIRGNQQYTVTAGQSYTIWISS